MVWDTLGARHIYGVEVTADAAAVERHLATLFPTENIEVTARGTQFENGNKLGTWSIIRYSDAYELRRKSAER